ncbi:unnamed protein product [Microthlaspi erraticum]|uniref:F-box domain-containing protein n=1 Tax=Microthlaspi erraticum TaxID=1685480 RepID=A0A6D2IN63_9BRAS|nr:unnamed protein product [Microthlaspi erraticum]
MAEKKNLEYRDEIPEDILLQILLRLPAKSLGRFVSVSKSWARIIRGQDFIRLFSSRPCATKQPRFLLAFTNEDKCYQESWSFLSKEEAPELLSSTRRQLKSRVCAG